MSRLYDRLLVAKSIADEMRKSLHSSVVIVGDNVAQFYYSGTDQEYWSIWQDFPNLAPPFENAFYDFHAPKWITSREFGVTPWQNNRPRAWGIWAQTEPVNEQTFDIMNPNVAIRWWRSLLTDISHTERYLAVAPSAPSIFAEQLEEKRRLMRMIREQPYDAQIMLNRLFDRVKWITTYALFLEYRKDHPTLPIWVWDVHIRDDGSVPSRDENLYAVRSGPSYDYGQYLQARAAQEPDIFAQMHDTVGQFLHTALLTTCFLHCHNVKSVEHAPTFHTTRKAKRAEPLVTYYTLDIEPMRAIMHAANTDEPTSIKRSLHLCRGHFAHYTPEKPLFGRYSGTFWIPQHARGSIKQGAVVKDYRVKL